MDKKKLNAFSSVWSRKPVPKQSIPGIPEPVKTASGIFPGKKEEKK